MKRIGFAFTLAAVCASAGGRPFGTEDLWNWRRASDARISPDGSRVVYVEHWNDRQRNSACANLWMASTRAKDRVRLTDGPWRDSRPRWSPDGARLAYISDREGSARIRIRGGDGRADGDAYLGGPPLGTPEREPLELAWSPDGAWIAFTARVTARPAPAPWAPPGILPRLAGQAETRIGIFVVPAAGGPVRAVSSESLDCRGEPAWMPGGRTILTSTADGDLVALRVSDGASTRLATGGRNERPLPSPDGARIARLATQAKTQSYVVRKLWVTNADGSRARALSGSLDRDAEDPQWSSDSRTIYFLADDRGATHVYAARNDGTVRQLTSAGDRLRGLSLADDGSAVTVRSTREDPGAVTVFSVYRAAESIALARPNEALLAGRQAGTAEALTYDSAGRSIEAWLVKPPDFDASRKYPLLLDIRDDPRRMCGPQFNLRAQVFAARGYVVLCANPRGTPGYGEAFGNLLRTGLPGDEYDDLMRGVDAAVARGYIDPKRLMVVGGLVAAWAIGHTDRFAAAVARHPIVNWFTDIATAEDGARRAATWMGAMPWDDPDQYMKRSPLFFAQNFRIPTLVLARARDPEAEELYFALQSRRVDSALVRLSNSGRPGERILEWETVLGWLGR